MTTFQVGCVLVLAAMLVGCGGQQQPRGKLTFHDAAGKPIASAEIDIPNPPPATTSFQGTWKLLGAEPSFPKGAVREGHYIAAMSGGQMTIDLNPGTEDNNVILMGAIANGKVTGNWTLSTFAGDQPMGRFELVLSP